jgi:hypothetical protein
LFVCNKRANASTSYIHNSYNGNVKKCYAFQIDQIIGGLSPFDNLYAITTDIIDSANTTTTTGTT